MKVSMIRHFQTEGNKKKRYIGITDEPLAKDAMSGVDKEQYPSASRVYISPLLRCRQTAAFLYPEAVPYVCEALKECDFGRFENKNYLELADEPLYQAWIDSNGTTPFPEGESKEEFKERTMDGFYQCLHEAEKDGAHSIVFVVHGGTIMSVMEEVAKRPGSYYEWQVANGNGFSFDVIAGQVTRIEKIEGKRKNECT